MKNIKLFVLLIAFSACSIFQPTKDEEKEVKTDEKVDEVYVFDEVSESEDNNQEIKNLEKELDKTLSNKNKNQKVEVDVFDEPSSKVNDLSKAENSFYLQMGAFSTLKSAEQFVDEIESQVQFKLSIVYNSNNSLYTVRSSAYSTKNEVEQIRNDFWSRDLFKDSFIVTE